MGNNSVLYARAHEMNAMPQNTWEKKFESIRICTSTTKHEWTTEWREEKKICYGVLMSSFFGSVVLIFYYWIENTTIFATYHEHRALHWEHEIKWVRRLHFIYYLLSFLLFDRSTNVMCVATRLCVHCGRHNARSRSYQTHSHTRHNTRTHSFAVRSENAHVCGEIFFL